MRISVDTMIVNQAKENGWLRSNNVFTKKIVGDPVRYVEVSLDVVVELVSREVVDAINRGEEVCMEDVVENVMFSIEGNMALFSIWNDKEGT